MGNENSISNEPTENGIIPEKHENGSANGISANITSDGLGIDVKSETMVQHNCEPLSLSLATESSEPDSNVVKSDSEPAEAQVISEAPEPTTQKEDTKKKRERVKLFGKVFKKKPAGVTSDQGKETSNEDQTTATGTKPIFVIEESSSSGEKVDITVIIEHLEFEHLRQSRGAGDTSPDVVLVEIAKPGSNAVAPDAEEAGRVPSLDEEPATLEVETVSDFGHVKSDVTPAHQVIPIEDLPAYEKFVNDAPTVENVAEQRNEKSASFPEDNFIIVEVAPSGLTTIKELCEDYPVEVMTTDENIEIGEDVVSQLEAEQERNLVTAEIIMDEEADKRAECGSSGAVKNSAQDSQSVDMEALLVGLQSACALVIEISGYKLAGVELASMGHSITAAIHVAPKTEQQ